MLIAGTVFAWAVSLRLLSDALFAALSAYIALWGSLALQVLFLLGLYRPRSTPSNLVGGTPLDPHLGIVRGSSNLAINLSPMNYALEAFNQT